MQYLKVSIAFIGGKPIERNLGWVHSTTVGIAEQNWM